MTTLPESVRNLTNLTELDLEQNRLVDFNLPYQIRLNLVDNY
jgi:Leucine-rich repeat (LRR) protein